jgi:hypothetical protein
MRMPRTGEDIARLIRITNQSGYCVSLATVFPRLTKYTKTPPLI